jgi:phosphoglucomutase
MDVIERIRQAGIDGKLLPGSVENITRMLEASESPVSAASVQELAERECWDELNDRFYKTLAFGTGGLRGRSIGKVVTKAEMGTPTALGRPEFPCTGTNALNYFNIARATRGLAQYVRSWVRKSGVNAKGSIVFAYDTRHFSREFAELAARVATESGCDAYITESPRSTPELSFAVRYLGATAGVVITASHNPPHDNGFKVYFSDGGQVVEPHASGIIALVNAITSDSFEPVPENERGNISILGRELDGAYMDKLESLLLQPDLVRGQKDKLKVVYSSIHGTGGVIIKPMLQRLGFNVVTVPEQDQQDGRFPTVKSPNPENAEALTLALKLAESENADLVLATDPDCDRMGAAVRTADGSMRLLTGNQIGSLMAYYRVQTMFSLGILNEQNASRGVIIKTFVTTDLQKAIAEHAGLRCVETLTGFKYIGAKLTKYEQQIPEEKRAHYTQLSEDETRALRLEHSSLYVCGGEESYGYSGSDFVRDKDGNGAVVMFAETAAYAKSRGLTLDQLLDEIYRTYGFYLEKNGSLVFEGAEGAEKIQRLAKSYASNPPTEALGVPVTAVRDFSREDIHDSEGDLIPKEKMLMVELADGGKFAVRPSGTEPKIKYYLFARSAPAKDKTLDDAALRALKTQVEQRLEALWDWLQKDAHARLA